MKRKIIPIVMLCSMALMLTACSRHDSNSDNYSYNGDAAITSFSLGTVNRYLLGVRKSTGVKDSVYKTTVTGSEYEFYIDQLKGEIYNPDSLPYGCDASHILATITSKNNGTIGLKTPESGDFYYYVSSDSIDFSQGLTIRVVSQNGENEKDYTVKVNVHKQEGNEFNWAEAGTAPALATAPQMRLAGTLNNVYALAQNTDGSRTLVYDLKKYLANNGESAIREFGPNAWQNVAVIGDRMFVADEGMLYSFENGQLTETLSLDSQVKQLLGASAIKLYALSTGGNLLSSEDGGRTWTTEVFNDGAAFFPTENLAVSWNSMRGSADNSRVVLAGTNASYERMLVWTKIEDPAGVYSSNWDYIDLSGDYRYAAPKLSNLSVLPYDGNYLALGMNAAGKYYFLLSLDGGITWKTNSQYAYPSAFSQTGSVFGATVDGDKFIWLADRTGKVWRGRLNRLGWKSANS